MRAGDIDPTCAVMRDTGGMEMRRQLLNLAAHIIIPISAVDDCDEESCAHFFLAAALGQLLLEVLCHGDGACLASPPGVAQSIFRLVERIHGGRGEQHELEVSPSRPPCQAHR